jgi:hypothetical protein
MMRSDMSLSRSGADVGTIATAGTTSLFDIISTKDEGIYKE